MAAVKAPVWLSERVAVGLQDVTTVYLSYISLEGGHQVCRVRLRDVRQSERGSGRKQGLHCYIVAACG